MNYEKYIGKRVMISNDKHFGKIGTLINVVPSQWFTFKNEMIAHVVIDDRCSIFPVTEIVLLKEVNE